MNAARHTTATLHNLPRRRTLHHWSVRAEAWDGRRIITTVWAYSQADAERQAADAAGIPLHTLHRSSVIRLDDAGPADTPTTTGLQDLAATLATQRAAMDAALAREAAANTALDELMAQQRHQITTPDAPVQVQVPERLRPAWMTPHYTRLGALLLVLSAVSAVMLAQWLITLASNTITGTGA